MKTKTIKFLFLMTSFIIFGTYQCIGQEFSKAQISNIDFSLEDGKIVITYDLMKSEKGEYFLIYVNAIIESGDTILARTVSGDVNENVTGGRKKSIIWDYKRDNFFTNEPFQIEVNALSIEVDPSDIPISYGDYPGLGKSFLMSTVFPGWASTKLKEGKPHWIKGIVGYGCLTLSYVYNNKATQTYKDYKVSMDREERSNLYNDAISQKQLSSILAFSAIAVWIMDYTCIIVSHNKLMKNTYNSYIQKVSFGYDIDPYSTQPLLSVKLTF
jgi:hypothetical protein